MDLTTDELRIIIQEELDAVIAEKRKKAGTESSKESSLRDWFGRKGAKGKKKGWVDCNAPDGKGGYKSCGRSSGEKRKKYPACRPTMAQCTSAAKKKTGPKRISWQKKSTGGEMVKNKSKADLNKDGKLSSYEMKRGMAIEKAMAKQNRVKMKNGGFIAKGCGQVMNNRRKVTSIS